jgi:hypothetical protein
MQVAFRLFARVGASVFRRTGRALLSAALALALLTASMHHLLCCPDESSGQAAAATISILEKAPLSVDQDQCPPGHCHCICHTNGDVRAETASVFVEFVATGYSDRVPNLAHSCTVGPPFEPPCA